MKRALVFTSSGLGDGLLFLVLSYNLFKNGYVVDTYHPSLSSINDWFGSTNIKPYPKTELSNESLEGFDFLKEYDLIIINSDYSLLNKAILKNAKLYSPDITFELHPSTCKGKKDPIGSMKFDFRKNIIENFEQFCKKDLAINNFVPSNGISIPKDLHYRKYSNRVVIHPTSKDKKRNWPKEKYKALSNELKKLGYQVALILNDEEKKDFEDFDVIKPFFSNLNEIAAYIYESGFMIGNDSGIGHLASNLKIPTITIFASKRKENFWRPYFFTGLTLAPRFLINIKGLRLRDRYWMITISCNRVLNKFKKLVKDFK